MTKKLDVIGSSLVFFSAFLELFQNVRRIPWGCRQAGVFEVVDTDLQPDSNLVRTMRVRDDLHPS